MIEVEVVAVDVGVVDREDVAVDVFDNVTEVETELVIVLVTELD